MARWHWAAATAAALVVGGASDATAQKAKTDKKVDAKKAKEVWTDASDPSLPADFAFQGEYEGTLGDAKAGAQVISLGKGHFQAVLLGGGLPGAGWNGTKSLLHGELKDGAVVLTPASGKRKYLAGNPLEFSATATFPPKGHQDANGTIRSGVLSGKTADGKAFELKATSRKSPTLGAKAPAGAIVLFDGSDTKEWKGGRLDKATGLLNTDGADIKSVRTFNNYTVHAEFLLPYRPDARGQGRGNSGFYQVHHYEVQILDSFGLDGKNNECSGIYTKAEPKLNLCLPPLQWQTYDIDFTNAVQKDGKKAKNARVTVRLNGVVVHDDIEISGPTGGHRSDPEGTPGPLLLQGHGNPLQFRNLWIVEKQ